MDESELWEKAANDPDFRVEMKQLEEQYSGQVFPLSIRDLTKYYPQLHEEGATFDTALPQNWVDDFKDKTGEFPFGFVWFYPKSGQPGHIWGKPFPLTKEAQELLAKYEKAIAPENYPNNQY